MSEIVFINDNKLKNTTVVENSFITDFMPAAPELAVKAYLYGLMLLSNPAAGDIETALGVGESELRAAFTYWEAAGLVETIGESPLKIRYLNIRDRGTLTRSGEDARFGAFVAKIQQVLGTRVLTGSELSRIYDWVEVFGFEEEAAVAIVRNCLDRKGARTGVAYMDSVAKTLAGKGLFSYEQVTEYFADELLMRSGAGKLLSRWHIKRLPTEDELKLYSKWAHEWGFGEDAVSLACEHMTAAEKPSFAYLDSVLRSWHEQGNIDPESIREMRRKDDLAHELARQAFSRAGLKSKPSREQILKIAEWTDEKSMNPELVLYAADLSNGSPRPFANLNELLGDWYSQGVSSVSAAKERYEAGGVPAKSGGKRNRALNYMHGGMKYTEDELKKMGISLGEEFFEDDE
jgi:DNA replication protein DnaD